LVCFYEISVWKNVYIAESKEEEEEERRRRRRRRRKEEEEEERRGMELVGRWGNI
jgi:hypothetical protein